MPDGAAIVARARTQLGRGIVYGTSGKAGSDPDADLCTPNGVADCSAFACWCLGIPRTGNSAAPLGLGTVAMIHDIDGPQIELQRIPAAQAGCLVVYTKDGKSGHCGIVTDPQKQVVIDCSDGKNGVHEGVKGYFWNKPGVRFAVPAKGLPAKLVAKVTGKTGLLVITAGLLAVWLAVRLARSRGAA